ncbi:MAG: SPOR domain-containing protein [Rickettsiales bacterium]|jgi:hypothetical protein|nr:SPOR domain-containing protein [Rickettsiales bacterium]
MNFWRSFSANRVLPVLALFSVMVFCFVLRRAHRVSRILRNPNELPFIGEKVENPKIKVSQKNSLNQKSNSFYSVSTDMGEKIRISPERARGNARMLDGGRAIDHIVGNIVDEKTGAIEVAKSTGTKNNQKRRLEDNRPGNGHRVQLVALRSGQQATNYVSRTRKLYKDMLKNLNVFVDELNLGEKGVFYRVQIGKFGTQEAALGFCENLMRRSADGSVNCILVR